MKQKETFQINSNESIEFKTDANTVINATCPERHERIGRLKSLLKLTFKLVRL
jgi:hypothetical protein